MDINKMKKRSVVNMTLAKRIFCLFLVLSLLTGVIPGLGGGFLNTAYAATTVSNQSGFGFSSNVSVNPLNDPITMAEYNSWPAGFTKGNNAFIGSVFDGQNIWLIPSSADSLIKLNPTNGNMTSYSSWPAGFTKGANAFSGGIYDGQNIWLIPYTSDSVIKVNKNDGSMTRYNNWPVGINFGTFPFMGATFDGQNIWITPFDANAVVKFNTSDGTMTSYNSWPAGFTKGTMSFAGAIYDGQDVWMIPYGADSVIKINPNNGSMTGYNAWPAGFTKGLNAFTGGVYDGQNIWLVPRGADSVIKVSKVDGSMTRYNTWPAGFTKGSSAFSAGVFDGQNIWLIPGNATHVIKVDATNGNMTAYNAWPSGFTKGTAAFGSGLWDGSNKIWMIPQNASSLITLSATVTNIAPTFVGATTTLMVNQNAAATDIKGLLHVSDSDSGQTLTWSQNAAPSHGTLSFSSATASSGSTDITPGGTITYTPTAGYAGSDSFTVQVSDGTATATRTITVTVNDVTAPTLTAGAVNRTSDTTGTVKFTSSEAGQYYYAIVNQGAGAPVINTSGAGTACTTSETTITNPTGLTAGAKDIYIKVKDASNNVSNALMVNIPAYVPPGKTLTADTTNNDVDHDMDITFGADATFAGAITGVSFNGHALTSNQYTVDTVNNNKITLHPSNADNTYLRTPATGNVVITATGYSNSIVSQTITAGTVTSLTVSTQPIPGASSGTAFATQPVITLKDQYNNPCSDGPSATVNVVATSKAGTGSWTIGGTTTKTAVAGVATFTDLTCTLTAPGNGAITFTCGTPTVDSSAFAIPSFSAKTLTADTTSNDVDHDIDITFAADASFEAAITGVSFNGNVLTANQYTVSSGKVTLKPSSADNTYLRTPATGNVVITATGYNNSTVSQAITPGTAASLVVSTQPVPGVSSGIVFATQPVVTLKDQYNNTCSTGPSATANVVATAKAGTGTWTIGGTTTKAAVAGIATFTDLTCTLTAPGNGAITFTSGTPNVDSNNFTIPSIAGKVLTADTTTNDVDHDIDVTFGADASFEAAITGVSFNGHALTANQYTVSSGKVTLKPSSADNTYLRTPATGNVVITATGYNNSTVSQTITAGAVASLLVSTQPVPGASSGTVFVTQPVVTLKDQYNNTCSNGPSATANVAATAKAGTGNWTIGGTATKAAVAGVATFTDLTCTLTSSGNGAITFTSGTPSTDSNTFAIPNKSGKTLTADTTSNDVDHDIEITFGTDASFEAAITGVSFNGNILTSNQYTVSSGKLTLKPSNGDNTYLRTAATGNVVITATGYGNSSVAQTITAGTAASMTVSTQPSPGTVSGSTFAAQPVVALKDQYNNICSNGPSATANVVATSKAGTGTWTIGGTTTKVATAGVATFTDLTCTLSSYGNGAVTFTSGTVTVDSNTFTIPPSIPGAPVIQSANGGDSHVLLTWNGVQGAAGYKIYQSVTSGVYGSPIYTAGSSDTSYDVTGLTNGTTYYFVIKATNAAGDSIASNEVSATPQIAAPGAPVIQSASAGDAHVNITWSSVSGATGYKVYISTTSGTYTTPAATVAGSVYSYDATGLTNGTTYYFVVKATNPGGDSSNSNEVSATPQVPAPGSPTGLTATGGNVKVTLDWNSVSGATGYKIFQSTTSGSYGAPLTTVTGSVYSYEATGLTNGTTYYFVVKAVNPGGDSPNSGEVSATPLTVPGAPTNVSASAGNGQATVTLTAPADNGGSPVTGYVVTSNPGNITATGTGTTITVTGLSNGTTYTFTVKAVNAVGNSADSTASNTVTPYRPSSGGSSGGSTTPTTPTTPTEPAKPTETGVDVLVNGKVENAGTATTVKEGDKTVTTIVVDEKKLDQKLAAEGNNAVVTIPVNTKADVVVGELNGQMVKNMENKQAVVEVKTETATYTLPAQQINIDAISSQLGKSVELKDIKVQIEIAKSPADTVKVVESSAKKGEFIVVAAPVDFTVKCISDNKTVEVSKFNAYVERTVAIPDGVDPSKITTGIVVEPDGTVRHVPTRVIVIEGKYYAKINSLTNSTYSVVWHPLEFKDAEKHWAKEAINDMGSRMVISGVGNDMFEPDRDITRAEFAAIVVRGLGLKPGTGKNPFIDVGADEWYTPFIETAYEYGIISGYGNGKFGPNDKITREQAMTMIARAMKITGLRAELKDGEIDTVLAGYVDFNDGASWAKESMAACVKTGIVSGKSGKRLAPKDEITRAEVAVIVRRLLQKSGLI